MDVSLYYDFECIVRYGSISEAAKHLHISQPALSRRVTSIEQEVGMELFKRTTPIQLTMAGEIFLEYACRINAEQYKLSTQMNRLRTTPVTVLRVAGLYSKKIGRAVEGFMPFTPTCAGCANPMVYPAILLAQFLFLMR